MHHGYRLIRGCGEDRRSPIAIGLVLFPQMQLIHPCRRNGGNHLAEFTRFTGKKGGTLHAPACFIAMSRHCIKTAVVSLLAFVLLYYGVAWVVLSCFHEGDITHHPAAHTVTGVPGGNTDFSFPRHAHVNLDCLDSDYHTESLSGPSSSSQLAVRVARLVSNAKDELTPHVLTPAHARRLWLKAVLDRFPSTTFLIHLPRYISFSVLRI